MADANFKELKKGGFMKQKQKDRFSMRLKTIGGQVTIQQLETIRHVAVWARVYPSHVPAGH